MNHSIVIFLIVLLLVAFVGVVVALVISRSKANADTISVRARTLKDYIDEGAVLRGENLQNLIAEFLATQKLPLRQGGALSTEAARKLEFVRAVGSNPYATAKDISFLNRELVKQNSAYKNDIDNYEKQGIARRKG